MAAARPPPPTTTTAAGRAKPMTTKDSATSFEIFFRNESRDVENVELSDVIHLLNGNTHTVGIWMMDAGNPDSSGVHFIKVFVPAWKRRRGYFSRQAWSVFGTDISRHYFWRKILGVIHASFWRGARQSGYEIEICPHHQILAWRGVYAGAKLFMKWTLKITGHFIVLFK